MAERLGKMNAFFFKASLLTSLRMGYSSSNFRLERVKIQWLATPERLSKSKFSKNIDIFDYSESFSL